MPTVPRLIGTSVAPAALPGYRTGTAAPAEAFGAGATRPVSAALHDVAQTADVIWAEQKRNADQIAMVEADNRLGDAQQRLLFDPTTGALQRRGRAAADAPEQLRDGWDTATSEIMSTLTNERQKTAFAQQAASRWHAANEAVQRHVASEFTKYDTEQTQTFVQNQVQEALLGYMDQGRIAGALSAQGAALLDYGRRNGQSDEEIAAATTRINSMTLTQVLGRMLANDQDLDAKVFYTAYRAQFTGSDASTVEKALHEGSSRGASQRLADSILSTPDITETAAVKAAREEKDPLVRDLTEQRIRQDFQERKNAATAARQQTFQSASDYVESTGGWKAVPPTLWIGLSLPERQALDNRREQLQKGLSPVTNWARYYELMSLASTDDTKAAFLQHNLMQDRTQLADGQFEQLTNLQSSLRRGEGRIADLGGYRTVTQVVTDALSSAGIDPTPKPGTSDASMVALFHRRVDEQVEILEQNTKKKVTPLEAQAIADNLMVQGTASSGSWWLPDVKARAFTVAPGEPLTITVRDIPPAEVTKIKAALKYFKRPATDANIVELYQRRKLEPMTGGRP